MCETLYAEVDPIETVVYLVKRGHYSGVPFAIFVLTHPSNTRNRAIIISRTGVTKRHRLGHL